MAYWLFFIVFIILVSSSSIFGAYLHIKELPIPISNQYTFFDFSPSESIKNGDIFSFVIRDKVTQLIQHAFCERSDSMLFVSIFPEAVIQPSGISCYYYEASDAIARLNPTFAGLVSLLYVTVRSYLEFASSTTIPANVVVSCMICLSTKNYERKTLPLELDSQTWSIINKVSLFPYNPAKFVDPLLDIELFLSYTAGDAILGGERMDYLKISIENLPPNVVLPFTLGFSDSEKHLNNIHYLTDQESEYIANIWGALKLGSASTRSPLLTPDDEAFYQQSFDMPRPFCGFDVRIVYSRPKKTFSLVTGSAPAKTGVVCTIPIPIFYLHGSIAQHSTRLRLDQWTGTLIIPFLRLDNRLFGAVESHNNPKWWFNGNPHLLPYSSWPESYSISSPDPYSIPPPIISDYQLVIIGPTPSFNFHKFLCHPDFSLSKFFTPVGKGGFLLKFGYITSPSHFSHHETLMKPLEFDHNNPFGHIYSFEHDPNYNGYIRLFIRFEIPFVLSSLFSLQLQIHQVVQNHDEYYHSKNQNNNNSNDRGINTKTVHLGDPFSLTPHNVSIESLSDTHITFEFSFSVTAYLPPQAFPLDIELTHILPIYEFRPADQLMPNCTVIGAPDSHPEIIIEQNPVLTNFSDDISYFIRVNNLLVSDYDSHTILCTYKLLPHLSKPPLKSFITDKSAILCFKLIHNGSYGCSKYENYRALPSGTWTEISPSNALPATFHANLATPLRTPTDFDEFIDTVVSILKAAHLPLETHGVKNFPFESCLTRDMLRDPIFLSPEKKFQSYHGDATYPLSFSSRGWDDNNTTVPFAIDSLSLFPNGAVISFVIHDGGLCSQIDSHVISQLMYTSRNGVIITQPTPESPNEPPLGLSVLSPHLSEAHQNTNFHHINMTNSPQNQAQPYIGRKPGGAQCYSHHSCWTFATGIENMSPYRSCFNGYCTTSSPSLTPYELRIFHQLMLNPSFFLAQDDRYRILLRSNIDVNTAYDYIAPPSYKKASYIKIGLLTFSSLLLCCILAVVCKKKCTSSHLAQDENTTDLL